MINPLGFIQYIIDVANKEPTDPQAYWALFMNEEVGHKVLADLLQRYWINRTAGEDMTAEQTAYYEGQRSVITNLLSTLQLSQVEETSNE